MFNNVQTMFRLCSCFIVTSMSGNGGLGIVSLCELVFLLYQNLEKMIENILLPIQLTQIFGKQKGIPGVPTLIASWITWLMQYPEWKLLGKPSTLKMPSMLAALSVVITSRDFKIPHFSTSDCNKKLSFMISRVLEVSYLQMYIYYNSTIHLLISS